MPQLRHVLETVLYVHDVEHSARFYEGVLGLRIMTLGGRFAALDAGGGTVLLLFEVGSAAAGAELPGGRVPAHDGRGTSHVAFAVSDEPELDAWEVALLAMGVVIESRVRWPEQAVSLYLRDPDGHSVELATIGIWPVSHDEQRDPSAR